MYVAHKSRSIVNILRYNEYVILPVKADFLKSASGLVDSGNQSRAGTASAIVNCDVALLFNLWHQFADRDFSHKLADMIRRKELTAGVIAEPEIHKDCAEKILLGVFLKSHYRISDKLRKDGALLLVVLLNRF